MTWPTVSAPPPNDPPARIKAAKEARMIRSLVTVATAASVALVPAVANAKQVQTGPGPCDFVRTDSRGRTIASMGGGARLHGSVLARALLRAGFTKAQTRRMLVVAAGESQGCPRAWYRNSPRSVDVGPWQINSRWHPWAFRKGRDPRRVNDAAWAARRVYRSQGVTAWHAWGYCTSRDGAWCREMGARFIAEAKASGVAL